jgi:hypothetical protein
MTEEQRAALAARIAARDRALGELGLTLAEAALFHVVHYGLHNAPAFVAEDAARPDYALGGPAADPGGPLPLEDCRRAMADCLAKGWLRVVDKAARAGVIDDLRRGGFRAPVWLPWDGGMDFTPAGADLWLRFRSLCSPGSPPAQCQTSVVVHSKTAWHFRTREAALAWLEEARAGEKFLAAAGPVPVGPWRAQWWRRFPDGYRIDVEECRQEGAAGGCSSGSHLGHLPAHGPEAGPGLLGLVLDRHGLTAGAWLVLGAVACGPPPVGVLPGLATRDGASRLGIAASVEECRQGLQRCLLSGWVREVDEAARAEVAALLRAEPAEGAGGEAAPDDGDVDFTPAGAALYRRVTAEWVGPAWEDGLHACKELFREEHRYDVAEEGLREVAEEWAARGAVVRLVPLGPWCVTWWQRHPAGFRLEVEVRTP